MREVETVQPPVVFLGNPADLRQDSPFYGLYNNWPANIHPGRDAHIMNLR